MENGPEVRNENSEIYVLEMLEFYLQGMNFGFKKKQRKLCRNYFKKKKKKFRYLGNEFYNFDNKFLKR